LFRDAGGGLHFSPHFQHGVERIDRGWAGVAQGFEDPLQVRLEACRIAATMGAVALAVHRCRRVSGAVGVTLVRPAEKVVSGGYRGYFADPDGFLWEVCWNPFFPLDDKGNVCLPE